LKSNGNFSVGVSAACICRSSFSFGFSISASIWRQLRLQHFSERLAAASASAFQRAPGGSFGFSISDIVLRATAASASPASATAATAVGHGAAGIIIISFTLPQRHLINGSETAAKSWGRQ
jgi:hypothetical protein